MIVEMSPISIKSFYLNSFALIRLTFPAKLPLDKRYQFRIPQYPRSIFRGTLVGIDDEGYARLVRVKVDHPEEQRSQSVPRELAREFALSPKVHQSQLTRVVLHRDHSF